MKIEQKVEYTENGITASTIRDGFCINQLHIEDKDHKTDEVSETESTTTIVQHLRIKL